MSQVVSSGRQIEVVRGLPVRNVIVEGGNVSVDSGGLLINTRVNVGGVFLNSGGTANHTVLIGGQIGGEVGATLDMAGGVSISATVGRNANMTETAGRSVDMVVNGGEATIFRGSNLDRATASGTRVTAGGHLQASQGATLFNTVVTKGGGFDLEGALARGTTISAGGSETLSFDAREVDALVENGGKQSIGGGSTATGTVVEAHGTQIIDAGTAINTIVKNGGVEILSSAGVAKGAIVRSGGTVVLNGGTFSGFIAGGAQEIVAGYKLFNRLTSVTYEDLHVAKNVQLGVRAGGVVGQTVVASGGTLTVSSGGTAGNTILGGHEVVSSGGHLTGTQSFRKGAVLTVGGTKAPQLIVSDFGATNAIDFVSFAAGSGESVSVTNDVGKKQTTVLLTDGSLQAKIVLFGQYSAAGFDLKSDGVGGSLLTYSSPTPAAHPDLAGSHH